MLVGVNRKYILNADMKKFRDAQGQEYRWGVISFFDRNDGLPGNAKSQGEFLLGSSPNMAEFVYAV